MAESWWLEKNQRTYLFIDGGYLRAKCREMFRSLLHTDEARVDVRKVATTIKCAKAFYYDCLDEQRADEDSAGFASRSKAQREQFDAIRSLSGFHVVEGTLTGRRQKEVDVALAVDMLTHAFNRNMGWAHLVAGDLDFRPLVQALVRLGIYVTVWSVPTSAAKPLLWAADDARYIDPHMLHGWCDEEFRKIWPLPRHADDAAPMGKAQIQSHGALNGAQVKLYQMDDGQYAIRASGSGSASPFRLLHHRRDELVMFFNMKYGAIEWTETSSGKS